MKLISSFFNTYRNQLLIVLLFLCLFLLGTNFSFAQAAGSPDGATDGSWLGDTLSELVVGLALGIGGIVASLGGALLNGAIYYTVITAGQILGDNSALGIGTGINELWKVVRDIFNIVFIFSFIYIGIKTILNADDSGAKRSLGYLIVAALLINFSLYFTQVIIDFSNIAATQVYNQIESGGMLHDQLQKFGGGPLDYGIAGAFQKTLSLNNFFDNGIVAAGQVALYAILAMFFLIIAGIVFAMGGILLIKRFVVLIIYMILSPIMFAGWILPAFMSYQEKWRKEFIRQAFFAPAFLFMIYLSLASLQSMQKSFGIAEEGYKEVIATGDVSMFSIFLFFCVGIGFLYGSIKIGDMMGASGASGMLKSLDAMKGMAQSMAYRNTVGRSLRGGVKILDAIDRKADDGKGIGGKTARIARTLGLDESVRRSVEASANKGINGGRGLDAVEKDEKTAKARNARFTQTASIGNAITAGAGAPLNSDARNKMERAVKDASSAQILEMFKDDKDKINSVAGELSDSQVKAIMDDKEIDDVTKGSFAQARSAGITERLTNPTTPGGARANIDAVIGKADASELSALGFETAKTNAGKLSAKQIEDWKDLTTTEKTQLKTARKDALEIEFGKDLATGNLTGANAATLFGRIKNDEERSKLPDSILKDPASAQFLNTNVLTKIVDNPGIGDADRTTIKGNVMALYPAGNPAVAENRKKYLKFFGQNNAGQRY